MLNGRLADKSAICYSSIENMESKVEEKRYDRKRKNAGGDVV